MFEEACRTYEGVYCEVGGEADSVEGTIFGSACLLSSMHVITAAHNVRKAEKQLGWPVVSKFDGIFKCDTVAIDDKIDIALLRTTDRIIEVNRLAPSRYPEIATTKLEMGMMVGYMAWLLKGMPSGRKRALYFSAAHVAYLGECELGSPRWVLNSGFVEPGFSGAPVFLADGRLIGVITDSVALTQELSRDGLDPIVRCFAQASSLPTFAQALAEEIRQAAVV